MNDGLDVVFLDDGRYQILVPGLADDEGDARGDRPVQSSRKIVEHDDALAGGRWRPARKRMKAPIGGLLKQSPPPSYP
jgi:hypothetical protein